MSRKPTSRPPSKTDREISRVRHAIVGSVLILAAVVLGLGIYYTTGTTTGEIVAGKSYVVIEDAPARKSGEPILVQEFFSYACPHCREFDPMLENWQKTMPSDVRFERVPATFSPAWTVLAQTYYALETLGVLERNHDRLFHAIHDTGRQFPTIESVADFVDGNGTTRDAFLAAANGPAVRDRLRQAERAQRTLMVEGVPTLVVAGRYVVGMQDGRKAAVDAMDGVIAKERAGTAAPAPAGEAPAASAPAAPAAAPPAPAESAPSDSR